MDLSTLMPQQRDIVTTLDKPLFVSAGAGSGKTFTLTRRILWALSPESGPYIEHLDQVLAITFTKDAAAEIRDRVRRALLDAGMDDESLLVDDAWISTIHGMCSRILRAHALELGIDPEFQVLEGPAAQTMLGQAIDHVLGRVSAGDTESDGNENTGTPDAFRELVALYPMRSDGGFGNTTTVRQLVQQILELASRMPHGLDDIEFAHGSIDFSALTDAYRSCLQGSPKAREFACIALDAIETFEKSDKTLEDLVTCMIACRVPRKSKSFPQEQGDLFRAELADTFTNAIVACTRGAMHELQELCRLAEAEYRELKSAASLLDNNDLLRLTSEALQTHADIRAAYAGRFKLVMIDEFQDTDQQQVDLISQLAGKDGRALCTVGDAQQSIYRFRGADVEVFRRQERTIAASVKSDAAGACLVKLVRNFRSHAEVLEYVARIFNAEQGGLMRDFLDLEPHAERKDTLVVHEASRRQALLVVGGTSNERTRAKADAIAHRFRALADAGQPVGDMVLLLGRMTNAGVYAEAFRAQGLDCVISGGSVFASAPEVAAVRALVYALANPMDTASGLAPLLASPMFALGVEEFLALTSAYDSITGETSRRSLDFGLMASEDAPDMGELPLLTRAREVLRRAFARVGHDSFSQIARDVVNESGWLVRLAAQGAQGRAVAANVLKALDVIGETEAELGSAPRQIALAFDAFLEGTEAPGALNEQGAAAVRIMTAHASKGLEFPVVAVSECFSVRASAPRVRFRADAKKVRAVAIPQNFPAAHTKGDSGVSASDVDKYVKQFVKGSASAPGWLKPELMDDVSATGSAAEEYIRIGEEGVEAELEERARLLYVAMTRAKELLILAMDAGSTTLASSRSTDLTSAVLEQILPHGLERLDDDHLVFENSKPGDFELIALSDFACKGQQYSATVDTSESVVEEELPVDAGPADSFTLVRPQIPWYRMAPAPRASRDSYSYSSMAAASHKDSEDRVVARDLEDAEAEVDGAADVNAEDQDSLDAATPADKDESSQDNPLALGSAFHTLAQWMIETGSSTVPSERIDAQVRLWHVSAAQQERLQAALARWEASDVRAELLAWPCVRAEVPFFSLGMDEEEVRANFGTYAEGAIDALATDPSDPARALVIDYKTGGSPTESPELLQKKHELQARVYADVLHRAGYADVTLKFVRVEIDDSRVAGQPQVVTYHFAQGA